MVLNKKLASFWKIAALFIVSKTGMIFFSVLVYFKFWSTLLWARPKIPLFVSWFVLVRTLPGLGIPRMVCLTKGQTKELVTITIKGEIDKLKTIIHWENSQDKLKVLTLVTEGEFPLPHPLWSSLLHLVYHWMKMLDLTFNVEWLWTFIICAVSTRKVDMEHTLLKNILIPLRDS